MSYTVVGIFNERSDAEDAEERLASSGFPSDNIDISRGKLDETSAETATELAPEGRQPGKIRQFFRSLFGEDQAERYSDVARGSDTIVTVHAETADQASLAARLLDDAGAIDIDQKAAEYTGAGLTPGMAADTGVRLQTSEELRAEPSLTGTLREPMIETESSEAIPVIREEVQVGKRIVETGGARIRARIIERPVEESLRLREEHVRVVRRPVSRPATPEELSRFQGGQIEVVEHAEVPVVAKKARVVEEVELMKETRERTEVVREMVRNTEVDVDEFAGKDQSRREAAKEAMEDIEEGEPVRRTEPEKDELKR